MLLASEEALRVKIKGMEVVEDYRKTIRQAIGLAAQP